MQCKMNNLNYFNTSVFSLLNYHDIATIIIKNNNNPIKGLFLFLSFLNIKVSKGFLFVCLFCIEAKKKTFWVPVLKTIFLGVKNILKI